MSVTDISPVLPPPPGQVSNFINPHSEGPKDRAGPLLQWFLATELLYYAAICFCKLSIVAFYLGFCTNTAQTHVLYGFFAIVASYNLSTILALVFACNPIAAIWDPKLILT